MIQRGIKKPGVVRQGDVVSRLKIKMENDVKEKGKKKGEKKKKKMSEWRERESSVHERCSSQSLVSVPVVIGCCVGSGT